MNPGQLLNQIIGPALADMGKTYDSRRAGILILATAAQESHCAEYVHQIGGPAVGYLQCEPYTHYLVWNWARENCPDQVPGRQPPDDRLVWDFRYATQIARLLYASWGPSTPAPTVEACWPVYKEQYNSYQGAATFEQFEYNWQKFVLPNLR